MEQRLLGISVSERDAGLGLEKVAFDLRSSVMGTQVLVFGFCAFLYV